MDQQIFVNTNILFRGVFLSHIESMYEVFEKRLLQDSIDDDPISYDLEEWNGYDIKVPKKFTDIKSWIQKTETKCWHCGLSITNIPAFLPTNIHRDHIDTEGLFCSWDCVLAYARQKYDQFRQIELNLNLTMAYERVHEKCIDINRIHPAPPKTIMIAYSGKDGCTEKEYIRKLKHFITI